MHDCPGVQVAARRCSLAPDGRSICTWWGSHGRSSAFCCRHCTRASRESCASWRSCLPCSTRSSHLEGAVKVHSAQHNPAMAVLSSTPCSSRGHDSAVHAALHQPGLHSDSSAGRLVGSNWMSEGLVMASCNSSRACSQVKTLLHAQDTPFPAEQAPQCQHSWTWQSSSCAGAVLAAAAWLACTRLSSSRQPAGPACTAVSPAEWRRSGSMPPCRR